MNTLRARIILHYLKRIPPVSAFSVCQELQPYIRLHQITITEQGIYFPETDPLLSALQISVPEIAESPRNRILISDVIDMNKTAETLEIFLKTGYVHILSSRTGERKVYDVYPDKDVLRANRVQLLWWVYSGKLLEYFAGIRNKSQLFSRSIKNTKKNP